MTSRRGRARYAAPYLHDVVPARVHSTIRRRIRNDTCFERLPKHDRYTLMNTASPPVPPSYRCCMAVGRSVYESRGRHASLSHTLLAVDGSVVSRYIVTRSVIHGN